MKGYTCNFTITAGRGTGKKTGILTRRGNGAGDGEEFSPAPFHNGGGEFSPLRGGAPTGSGNPRPIAIPNHVLDDACLSLPLHFGLSGLTFYID